MLRPRVNVTVTGAGGNIAYALMFRIASGELLGSHVPVALRLLDIPAGLHAAEGNALELQDGAFPLLRDLQVTDDPGQAFDGTNIAILVGSRPRGAGQQRADMLADNARIFAAQGAAINGAAADDIRVVVVGNPANTNALVAASHAPDVPADRFSALTRLDHNRAVAQLAAHFQVPVTSVSGVTIWGNHSDSQYPDVSHATIDGRPVRELVDGAWLLDEFMPRVAHRGAEIIAVRGASSMGSAASATVNHVNDWVNGTGDDWTSAGVVSDGSYGVPAGLVSSFPVRSLGGRWSIEPGLEIDKFSRLRIDASVADLEAERDAVIGLGLLGPR